MRNSHTNRVLVLQTIVAIVCFLFVIRLVHLQIIKKETFKARVGLNTRQRIVKYPSRGLLFDRNKKLLVYNDPIYDIKVTYNQVDPSMDTLKFCKLLGITKNDFTRRLVKDWGDYRYEKFKPYIFMKKVSAERYARLQENMYEFPGFYAELRNVRGYNYHAGAHILGYNSEVDQKILQKGNGYQLGDYIGETGVEKNYETYLKGEKGARYVLKDNLGRIQGAFLDGIQDTSAVSGKDLILSLDAEIQEYAEQLMQNKIGSVVALEPSSGEILALVSAPFYDPSLLSIGEDRNRTFTELNSNKNNPFLNRALSAQYPPGSIFKPILSLIAMNEGVTHSNRFITCNGGYHYKSLRVGCHAHTSCGSIEQGIAHSCNAYFCQLFRDVVDQYGFTNPDRGLDSLSKILEEFHLGKPIETDIGISKAGLVPDAAFYDKIYPKRLGSWKSPTIISLGIGQGEFLFTPIQMANLSSIIANEGHYYLPHAVKQFQDGTSIDEKYTTKNKVSIDESYFKIVKNGMEKVVQEGTARIAQIPGIDICGKTGTSQNPHGDDHSVFIAFAPKEDPKIAIAVFVENGGYGSRYAAPIASLVVEKYLTDTISVGRKWIEQRMLDAKLTE